MNNNQNDYPELREYMNWMDTFEKRIVEFHDYNVNAIDKSFFDGFKPYRDNTKLEDGTYVTMRCGLTGVYTVINEMKDNHWMAECLDGSTTIAYRKLTQKEENACPKWKN